MGACVGMPHSDDDDVRCIGVDPAKVRGPGPREILLARVHRCLDPRKMSEARL